MNAPNSRTIGRSLARLASIFRHARRGRRLPMPGCSSRDCAASSSFSWSSAALNSSAAAFPARLCPAIPAASARRNPAANTMKPPLLRATAPTGWSSCRIARLSSRPSRSASRTAPKRGASGKVRSHSHIRSTGRRGLRRRGLLQGRRRPRPNPNRDAIRGANPIRHRANPKAVRMRSGERGTRWRLPVWR